VNGLGFIGGTAEELNDQFARAFVPFFRDEIGDNLNFASFEI
jgi:hypothetical protein